MKKLLPAILVVLCARISSLALSMYDITIFKDAGGRTHAQVTSQRLALHLKVNLGDILFSSSQTLNDADIINHSIKSLEGSPSSWKQEIAVGNILIKRGVYDLGNEGIRVPWPASLVLAGEGFDVTLPHKLKQTDTLAVRGTYLIYSGNDRAFGYIPTNCGGAATLKITDLTFVLVERARAGIDIPVYRKIRLDRVAVIALKETDWGIRANSVGGNPSYFTNIIIRGPMKVGLDIPVDWSTVINVFVDGFIEVGMTQTRHGAPVVGGLLRCGRP